ncbi:MAG: BON domain-containing protein [Methylobacterium sp.]|nr:BON domain-containing protein [Methylobacterium sp.]
MRLIYLILLCASLSLSLGACAPAVVGGAAAGGLAAADRRTSGTYVEDEGIEWKSLTRISEALKDKIHINVTSFNRSVLLTGEAADEAARQKAESIAREVQNVRNVTNELAIGLPSSLASRSNDTYLTSLVKGNMIKDNAGRFAPIHVKVITENAVVYLMGMVTRKEAEAATEIARNTSGVQKVVTVFEYVVVE